MWGNKFGSWLGWCGGGKFSPPPPPPIIPSANSSFGVHLCAFVFWCVRLGEEAAFEDKPLGAGVGRQVRKSF